MDWTTLVDLRTVAAFSEGNPMLSLSDTTAYAIKALSFLGSREAGPVLVQEIARATGVPAPYLAKIMRKLRLAGIVTAKRGYRGGVQLARPAERVTLREVGEAIEGPDLIGGCLLGYKFCEDLTECPTRAFWSRTGPAIRAELQRITLADVLALQNSRAKARAAQASPAPARQRKPRAGVRR
jgi:Rrf2 family transcriptional regulator, iron-sulfur cluster assembly transcription factor